MELVKTENQPGMGAIPGERETTFRVWAPNADKVCVSGTFNSWSDFDNPMEKEPDGYWACTVADAIPGHEYKFIIYKDDLVLKRIDPYAREVTQSLGNAVIVDLHFEWGNDDYTIPDWNEVVIYEMHVGTFNPLSKGEPGTFQGVIDKLPYLRDLGINAIEIMPPMEFPGSYSWGYNPAHPFALESDYGGVKGFRELVKAAHDHGIAVILDVVYNHLGPSDLDLWQFDGWSENGLGGIYFYNDWRAKTPWGDTRPDYGRKEVRQYLRDNALMWLEDYRVDGLRFDAVAYVRSVEGKDSSPGNDLTEGWTLMQWINDETRGFCPKALTIAEDLQGNPWVTKPTVEGGAGFGSQWDASFSNAIRQALITPEDVSRDIEAVASAMGKRYDGDAFNRVIYTESHDEVANGRSRIPEEIWPGNVDNWFSKKRSTLGAAIALTSPGIPMLFQGQEFIEDRWFHDRDPLDWARADAYVGIVDLYRTLIRLRRNLDGVSAGLCGQNLDIYHKNNEKKIFAFHRWEGKGGAGNSVVVVVNMADTNHDAFRIGLPHGGQWKVRFNSDSSLYDAKFGNHPTPDLIAADETCDTMPYSGFISIGPYTLVVVSQD